MTKTPTRAGHSTSQWILRAKNDIWGSRDQNVRYSGKPRFCLAGLRPIRFGASAHDSGQQMESMSSRFVEAANICDEKTVPLQGVGLSRATRANGCSLRSPEVPKTIIEGLLTSFRAYAALSSGRVCGAFTQGRWARNRPWR